MNDPRHLTRDDERVGREAAAWVVLRDRGLTPREQDEFLQWLASDPRHRAALAREQGTWSAFDLLADWRPEHGAVPNPDLLARPARPAAGAARTRRVWAGFGLAFAAAACIAALVTLRPAFIGGSSMTGAGPAAITPADAYERRLLDDGSVVELRGDSEIHVALTAGERRVRLVRGEAFFTVAKDPARPFVVATQSVHVRAVGTAFNVRLCSSSVEVLVTGGKVQLLPTVEAAAPLPAAAQPAPAPAQPPEPTLLAAGNRALVPLSGTEQAPVPRVEAVTSEEIERQLNWHPRLLDFDATPLSEVVREFNRRNRTQLAIASPSLARLPIVASVQSHNVDGFVRLLERTTAVRAERQGDVITLRAAE